MLLMLLILVLAQTNGVNVSPWCWLIFGVQATSEVAVALAKAMKRED